VLTTRQKTLKQSRQHKTTYTHACPSRHAFRQCPLCAPRTPTSATFDDPPAGCTFCLRGLDRFLSSSALQVSGAGGLFACRSCAQTSDQSRAMVWRGVWRWRRRLCLRVEKKLSAHPAAIGLVWRSKGANRHTRSRGWGGARFHAAMHASGAARVPTCWGTRCPPFLRPNTGAQPFADDEFLTLAALFPPVCRWFPRANKAFIKEPVRALSTAAASKVRVGVLRVLVPCASGGGAGVKRGGGF
jgi:hypothetical protein